jgi:outer membrane receptor protein involved in Fe transport
MEKEFANVWSPSASHTMPNGSYSATFGDQFRVFGRDLGFVQSLSFSRTFEARDEFFRQPKSKAGQELVLQQDYQVRRDVESEQLGATTGLNYRLARGHEFHLRGFYTNSADDEVRLYEGLDNYGDPLYRRATRLMYVQRDVLSGSLEGRHDLPRLANTTLDWRLTRSAARRQQPDRRESMYIRVPTDPDDPNSGFWGLATGRREYGDLKDDAWGVTTSAAVPYRLGHWGGGKVSFGYDHQTKDRDNFYRRFDFIPGVYGSDAPPESVYDKVNEATLAQDNYSATQTTEALFLNADVPIGPRVRANLGVRREFGGQEVISHDLFNPLVITSEGHLSNTDWLGAANVTWNAFEHVNLRAAASRTLSRPDLDELSPRPTVDYVGSWQRIGNPLLERAMIENYDLRLEAFPGLSEVLAAGVFLKQLHHPIETALKGASGGYVLVPQNSASGRNVGVELEARVGLGRIHSSLRSLAINTNFSVISSHVELDDVTKIGSQEHPLQGQATHLLNAALTWQSTRMDASVLVANIGRRLEMLNNANEGIPDEYDPGITTLDATLGMRLFQGAHLKISGGNLLDQRVRLQSGDLETNAYRTERTFSVAFSFGS